MQKERKYLCAPSATAGKCSTKSGTSPCTWRCTTISKISSATSATRSSRRNATITSTWRLTISTNRLNNFDLNLNLFIVTKGSLGWGGAGLGYGESQWGMNASQLLYRVNSQGSTFPHNENFSRNDLLPLISKIIHRILILLATSRPEDWQWGRGG